MSRPRFDPTVSLGHIISVAGIVVPFFAWVIATNATQDTRIAVVENAVRTIASRMDDAEKRSSEVAADLRTGIGRIDDKLGALLIQGYRGPAAR